MDYKYSRKEVREIVGEINRYNLTTTYKVLDGKLWVRADGGLTEEQIIICKEFRDVLIEFFTTPPDEDGVCGHCHESPDWKLLPTGVWVCGCIDEMGVPVQQQLVS